MSIHRVLFAIGFAALITVPVTSAQATTIPVFTESFENCVHDDSPGYTNVSASLDSPMLVDLWYDDATVCDGWDFGGQAWLTRWVSGTPFADGEYALWLNEYPQGVAGVTVGGLTMGTEYTLEFDAWTDNDPADTWVQVEHVQAGASPSTTFELSGGSGPTHFSQTFVTDVEETILFFYGSSDEGASPIIDNITLAESDGSDDAVFKENSLAQTGYNPAALAVSGGAFLAGGLVLARRRRIQR